MNNEDDKMKPAVSNDQLRSVKIKAENKMTKLFWEWLETIKGEVYFDLQGDEKYFKQFGDFIEQRTRADTLDSVESFVIVKPDRKTQDDMHYWFYYGIETMKETIVKFLKGELEEIKIPKKELSSLRAKGEKQ